MSALPWRAHDPGWLVDIMCRKAGVADLSELDQPQVRVVLIVEKVQWADQESLRALLEWSQSISRATAAVVGSTDLSEVNEDFHLLADFRVNLPPLRSSDIAAMAVSRRAVHLRPEVCWKILEVTNGNADLVRDLLDAASEDHWRSTHPYVPVPRRWRTAFEARAQGNTVLINATQAATVTSSYEALVAILGGSEGVTTSIERGILQSVPQGRGRVIAFVHPTDLAVARSSAPPALIRDFHKKASEWFTRHDNSTQALLHRAKSMSSGNDDLAGQMIEHAEKLTSAGHWRQAFEVYHQASVTAQSPVIQDQANLNAIEALIADSDIPQANQHVRQLTSVAPNAHIDSIRGYLALHQGHRSNALNLINRSWSQLDSTESGDTQLRTRAASRQVLLSLCEWQPSEVVRWAQTTSHWALPESPLGSEAHYISLIGTAACTDEIPDLTPLAWETETMAQRRHMAAGWIYLVHDNPFAARQHLSVDAHGKGSERIAAWMDAWRARSYLLLGDLINAENAVERGLARCERYGISFLEPLLLWSASVVAGLRGDQSLMSLYSRQVNLSNDAFPIQQIPSAMARLYIAYSQQDSAAMQRAGTFLSNLSDTVDTAQPGFWPWRDIWASHLVNSGQLDEAEALIGQVGDRIRSAPVVSAQAKLSMSEGRLAFARGQHQTGVAKFDEALDMIETLSLPLYSARVLFDYGQALRRLGKRKLADDLFARASEYFLAMGADNMVARCGRERRAGGLGSRIPSEQGLTPQEKEIATLVAEGSSNKDVATALFLSPKTVEYHLTRVYRKLGVRNRSELGNALRRFDA
ncbi:LuxR family transcriptional regulator [Corynebacterium cystitidis]|uniref:LuxR family transcriptional regulator n=1 Tax=Corynebacterium cystitidis TaxID=35757 RepID=UPI001E411A4B|nr:LuxR family transcriptional regulator [Corynebacterium cystitidis]